MDETLHDQVLALPYGSPSSATDTVWELSAKCARVLRILRAFVVYRYVEWCNFVGVCMFRRWSARNERILHAAVSLGLAKRLRKCATTIVCLSTPRQTIFRGLLWKHKGGYDHQVVVVNVRFYVNWEICVLVEWYGRLRVKVWSYGYWGFVVMCFYCCFPIWFIVFSFYLQVRTPCFPELMFLIIGWVVF